MHQLSSVIYFITCKVLNFHEMKNMRWGRGLNDRSCFTLILMIISFDALILCFILVVFFFGKKPFSLSIVKLNLEMKNITQQYFLVSFCKTFLLLLRIIFCPLLFCFTHVDIHAVHSSFFWDDRREIPISYFKHFIITRGGGRNFFPKKVFYLKKESFACDNQS
jgi:hypothetical protein